MSTIFFIVDLRRNNNGGIQELEKEIRQILLIKLYNRHVGFFYQPLSSC